MPKLDIAAFPGVQFFRAKTYVDHRGLFLEGYRETDLALTFVQGNISVSQRGVIRGLHYQVRKPQGKLMRCVHGRSFNVAVDMRMGSPTFGHHVAVWLNDPGEAIWIPPGFAAGFCAIETDTAIVYECTTYHDPEYDRAVRWDDPTIGIEWTVSVLPPILSAKDAAAPLLADTDAVPEMEWRA